MQTNLSYDECAALAEAEDLAARLGEKLHGEAVGRYAAASAQLKWSLATFRSQIADAIKGAK